MKIYDLPNKQNELEFKMKFLVGKYKCLIL